MDEKQYLKLRAKAEDEYRKNLEALDRVWHMNHPDKRPPVPKASSPDLITVSHGVIRLPEPLTSNGNRPFVLSEAVKSVINDLPSNAEVSQPIILRKLLDRYPEIKPRIEKDQIKAQIAGMLSRMAKSDHLERIREAHGSEPGVFKRKPTPALSLED